MNAINKCKILDPACGSGAYPMSILNKLAFIMQKLDTNNEIWRQIQIKKATAETEKAFDMKDTEKRNIRLNEIQKIFDISTGEHSNYARKLFLIENCIYGIDLQPIAIQITKLRFFISLVVDQKSDGNIDNNYNVLPLPNLETKFIAANALIGFKQGQIDLVDKDIEKLEDKLLSIRREHFTTWEVKRKIALREKDEILTKELIELLTRDNVFTSSDAEKISRWNPYKQTLFVEFFNSARMFNVTSFDIVIGNPPYIQLQSNSGRLANTLINAGYDCFSRSGDIYQIFYECGYKLLKEKGHLCFITSNKWMRAAYGEKTRNYFANKANPKLLIDFAGQRVFETATVDVNILLIQKGKNQQKTHSCIIKEDCKNNMTDYIKQHGNSISFPANGQSWVILSDIEKRIKEKIEKVGIPLKNWDINIYRGILTGCNEAFIIDKFKRDELIAKDKKSAEIIRPILRGRDISRYQANFADLYLINSHNGIPSKNILPIDIFKFPAIKEHLDKYWEKIKEREDKGITPYNLRSCAYMDDFSKQKIIYPNMTKFLPFVFDTNGFLINQKCFFITGKHISFLTAFFNSSLFKYCFRESFPELQGGTRELSKIFFDKISVLEVDENTNIMFETKITELQILKQQGIDTKSIEIEIDDILFSLYNLTINEKKSIGFIEII
jgi:tRNA1(Val) A37 N6-methylase TrmN6